MRRLLLLLFLFPVVSFAQVVVSNSGFATSPGPAVVVAPLPIVPLVVTPSVGLQTYLPNAAGASSHNGNLQVGATSHPVYLPPQSLAMTVPVFSNLYEPMYSSFGGSLAPEGTARRMRRRDLGSRSSLMWASAHNVSVAEIARQYRRGSVAPQHVYNNDDLQRLPQASSTVPSKQEATRPRQK